MAEFVEDTIVYGTANALIGAVEQELVRSGLPNTCSSALHPGALPIFERCAGCDGRCDGQIFARVASVYTSASFPDPAVGISLASRMASALEVGVVRCLPMDEDGYEDMELTAAARLQLADMAAVRRAICRVLKAKDIDFVLGAYVPYGPEGGCVGGWWPVIVAEAELD